MSRFTVRVELHGVSDYATLHEEMKARHFYPVVQDDTSKKWYSLPTAEYNHYGTGTATIDDALNLAIAAVNKAMLSETATIRARNTPPTIFITESANRRWSGLKEIIMP